MVCANRFDGRLGWHVLVVVIIKEHYAFRPSTYDSVLLFVMVDARDGSMDLENGFMVVTIQDFDRESLLVSLKVT